MVDIATIVFRADGSSIENVSSTMEQASVAAEYLERQNEDLAGSFDTLNRSARRSGSSFGFVSRNFRNLRGAVQNTSYQVQDFIVQMEMGVPVVRALGQQLPQVLSYFGPFGAILGVASAALFSFISIFGGLGEAVDKATRELNEFNDTVSKLKGIQNDLQDISSGFSKAFGAISESTIKLKEDLLLITQARALKQLREMRGSLQDTFDKFLVSNKTDARRLLNLGQEDIPYMSVTERNAFQRYRKDIANATQAAEEFLSVLDKLEGATSFKDINKYALEAYNMFKRYVDTSGELEQKQIDFLNVLGDIEQKSREMVALLEDTEGKTRRLITAYQTYAKTREQSDAEYRKQILDANNKLNYRKQIFQQLIDAAIKDRQEQERIAETSRMLSRNLELAASAAGKVSMSVADIATEIQAASDRVLEFYRTFYKLTNISFVGVKAEIAGLKAEIESLGNGASTTEAAIAKLRAELMEQSADIFEYGSVGEQATRLGQIEEILKKERERLSLMEERSQLLKALRSNERIASKERLSALELEIQKMEKLNTVMGGLSTAYLKYVQEIGNLAKRTESIFNSVVNSFEDGFIAMVEGTQSVGDAFRSMARDIVKELYRVMVVQRMVASIGGFLTGLSGFNPFIPGAIAARAEGGSVSPQQPYLVGERGPELFVPKSSGYVVPNNKISGDITVVQNINITSATKSTIREEFYAMMPEFIEAAKSAFIEARRSGGQVMRAFS